MAVSKRVRFEVLKRDNHTCRYCHATDSPLTVDHVTPVALGGSDDPGNLVAACQECNAGKASTSPDAELVSDVAEDDLRWAEAVKRAAEHALSAYVETQDRHAWFVKKWQWWDPELLYLPSGWDRSLDHWLSAGLPAPILNECLGIAVENRAISASKVFAYMGGIARRKIEAIHDDARRLLDAEESSDGT